eukprot:m.239348 g.239348  ORF g.239348 m.239348 type:complete len:59 (+) comp13468_c0_seq1:44-220(+)
MFVSAFSRILPFRSGVLNMLGSTIVMAGGITAGAYLSATVVRFVEDNNIWHPSDDDDD